MGLQARIGLFIDYCSTERCHESLKVLTSADAYYGHRQAILNQW